LKTVWLLVVLLTLAGWLCVQIGAPVSQPPPSPTEVSWRRTANGWENAGEWTPELFRRQEPLHPGLIASFCLLASLFALTAFAEPAKAPEIIGTE
jgi:hypothetical protein